MKRADGTHAPDGFIVCTEAVLAAVRALPEKEFSW